MRATLKRMGGACAGMAMLVAMAAPAYASYWVRGFYGPNGGWHPGHWAGGPGPIAGPGEGPPGPPAPGHHWVSGWYGPNGGWHHGYWAVN